MVTLYIVKMSVLGTVIQRVFKSKDVEWQGLGGDVTSVRDVRQRMN